MIIFPINLTRLTKTECYINDEETTLIDTYAGGSIMLRCRYDLDITNSVETCIWEHEDFSCGGDYSNNYWPCEDDSRLTTIINSLGCAIDNLFLDTKDDGIWQMEIITTDGSKHTQTFEINIIPTV